uniref:Activator of Hsp90 ATPase homologue 1/2-like C-terminal domain-containing protein n=1 Tax=Chromera velia CCMP2878 TaxID=1169474 RepID=A0A0G4IAE6_9ALVE|mmetsp:Transcript_13481/g.26686  ORF Transcript_13481/g.26686 Transcript_13481/m.26686 type:complete len:141 (-) Transcript_13481:95-517(-)|eukprot:Cvel_12476.t1-p1 / transcript=Cvel_12476.t1 / gene=Cvel_12476 / organism=Chromera_velia_CCMP2878 / gene_product=Activator of 90 kDa heat shock protein ATPase, putative / transcript_product=Activator of 90 kDa heat shock protein ATPase, putative / location=Cvel_scaffold818:14198-17463(+) / protein_length=140 / sequence_SO=supercontig / SO=protein_coding / is_pseudo=false
MEVKSSQEFLVPARVLYSSLLDQRDLLRMSRGAPAEIQPEVGFKFSLFGGSITGENIELVPNEKIVQKWRFADWPDDCASTVVITFKPTGEESAVVELCQTGVPEADKFDQGGVVERVREGWQTNFWDRMEQMLGYPKRK